MRSSARRTAAHPAETVVALAPLKADPQRVRVMVRASGRSRARCACAIPREQAKTLRIKVGVRWSASVAARVEASHAAGSAREAALRMLANEPRALSLTTLARRLHGRGLPPSAVATAIRQLRSDGWISDSI